MSSMLYFYEKHPELAQYWHPTKNGNLTPDLVAVGSSKKIWFLGDCKHEWDRSLNSYVKGIRKCPYCTNKRILVGFNDMATTDPLLASEFHPTKNGNLTPQMIASGTGKDLWWLCQYGHEWRAKASSRKFFNTGCPFCANKQVLRNFNDLATTHPVLTKQWHPTKNGNLTPYAITAGSDKKVWWVDDFGHEWKAVIYSRTGNSNKNCPYCAGQKLLIGFNDLATTHPVLAKQWHPTLNGDLTPQMVLAGTDKKVWWLCVNGHDWRASVSHRSHKKGTGCPFCVAVSSVHETAVYDFVKSLGVDVKRHNRNLVVNREVDMFVPEKMVAVEFNGVYWHSEAAGRMSDYHYNKWSQCRDQGISLVQIWEDDWLKHPGKVKNLLANMLTDSVISLGDVTCEFVSPDVASGFVSDFSLRSTYDDSVVFIGSKLNNNVVALLVVNKVGSGNTFQVVDYIPSDVVVDSFGLLVDFIVDELNPDTVFLVSDNMLDEHRKFQAAGFDQVESLVPDFAYVVGNARIVKDAVDFDMKNKNGSNKRMTRIWDAGKTVWVKRF